MNPRVSVILNCRNGADYLQQAIDSLLAQTFDDWELVAWDDGSTDDTKFILESYSDKRIRIVFSESSGSLSKVRSLAIQQCRGEWIAFLDQDDVWLPSKLASQIDLADRYPEVGLIYGRAIRFKAKGPYRDYDHRHEWSSLPEGWIFDRLFVDSCFICMSSVILRKTALARIDPIPTHVRLAADYYLYLALSLHFEARAFPEPVCLYREHDTNLSCRSGRELQFECVRLINQFCPLISPSLARSRRRIHHSLIAFADMSHLATFRRGFKHLLAEGSLSYLASRPVVRCYRRAKRSIVRPYWKQFDPHPEARVKSQELFKKPQLTQASPRQFTLLDTNICTTTFAGAQNFLASMVEQRVPGYICNANTYSVIYARDDYRHRRAIAGASYVNADGMPLVWLLRALGQPMERVHGDDLFLSCCEQFPEWRHFLVGGRDGQGELVAAELKRRYPTLNLVGFRSTPSRPPSAAESASIVQQIREVNASIVWVGMGTPSQDFWMSWAAMSVGVPMAGVGSSFDVLAGYTQAAPEWMKRCGLQWLFRLVQEPRRLARRYLYYNSRFLLAAAREWPRLFRRSVRTAPTEGLRAE